MEKINYQSPMGTLMIVVRGGKIVEISLKTTKNTNDAALQKEPVLLKAMEWLDAYFHQKTLLPLLPLIPAGTKFQQAVWQECMLVPWGQTLTYGDLAKRVALRTQKPSMSAQAVGQALSKNPILLMIPCHRIVAKGGIGGFSSGLALKTFLLEHEQ